MILLTAKKQISFDLDTKELKKYYPKKNWRKAYDDIKAFMILNDFEWIQGSVYVSRTGLRQNIVFNLIRDLCNKFPYLNKSMRDCVVTNVGKTHNLNAMFDKSIKLRRRDLDLER